jgi:hypothetical protein
MRARQMIEEGMLEVGKVEPMRYTADEFDTVVRKRCRIA